MVDNFIIECSMEDHSILCLITQPAMSNSRNSDFLKNGCRGDTYMEIENTATVLYDVIAGEQLLLQ